MTPPKRGGLAYTRCVFSSDEPNRRSWSRLRLGVVAVAVLAVACGSSQAGQAESSAADAPDDTAATTTPTTTTTATTGVPEPEPSTSSSEGSTTTESTAESGPDAMINQAESDLRFDYGQIMRAETVDGTNWIWFDRWSFADQAGPELDEEPRYEMATDWHGGANVNPKLRAYPLAPNVQVLELDPDDYVAGCEDLSLSWDFIDSDVQTLIDLEALVSLSFDANNAVLLVRDQRTC